MYLASDHSTNNQSATIANDMNTESYPIEESGVHDLMNDGSECLNN